MRFWDLFQLQFIATCLCGVSMCCSCASSEKLQQSQENANPIETRTIKSEILFGDDIDESIRTEVNRITHQAFQYLQAGESGRLENLASEQFKRDLDLTPGGMDNIVTAIRREGLIAGKRPNELPVLFEVYSDLHQETIQQAEAKELSEFEGKFLFLTKAEEIDVYREVYCKSFILKGDFISKSLSFQVVRLDGEWKIRSMGYAFHELNGKDTLQWREKALASAKGGSLIAATLELSVANMMSRPSSFYVYRAAEDISTELREMQTRLGTRLSFPLPLSKLPTKPEIHRIDFVTTAKEGLIPRVVYVSTVSLQDSERLREEAKQIGRHLIQIDPMMADFQQLFFAAYEIPPTNSQGTYKTYGTAIEMDSIK